MKQAHETVKLMWKRYLESIGESPENTKRTFTSWYFCDNEEDAKYLAKLVLQGIKRGTASLLSSFEKAGEPVPKAGDLSIVTDWNGIALFIIETCKVTICPFNEVTEEFTRIEGEGDGSLSYWRRVHTDFFSRDLAVDHQRFREDLPVVCEEFELVFE